MEKKSQKFQPIFKWAQIGFLIGWTNFPKDDGIAVFSTCAKKIRYAIYLGEFLRVDRVLRP